MKKSLILVFGITFSSLIGLQSCKTSEEVIGEQPADEVKIGDVETKEIAKGELYGYGAEGIEPGGTMINSQAEWDTLIKKMNSTNESIKPKSIDFEQRTVLAYFDQIRGSGGYAVEISSVKKINNLLATISKTSPDGPAIEIMTQPFYIVSIPKVGSGGVVWKELTE